MSRTENIRVQKRQRVKVERLFLTHAWHRSGILEADGYVRDDGYATNYSLVLGDGQRWFTGKLGYSIFRDRTEAVDAVKKKAAAKARELRRRIAAVEHVAQHGPDVPMPKAAKSAPPNPGNGPLFPDPEGAVSR